MTEAPRRSTQRLPAPIPSGYEEEIRAFLRDFAKRHPRWGWRRGLDALRDAGWHVNHKRVQRLWREEGLKVPYRKKKKRLTGVGVVVGAVMVESVTEYRRAALGSAHSFEIDLTSPLHG